MPHGTAHAMIDSYIGPRIDVSIEKRLRCLMGGTPFLLDAYWSFDIKHLKSYQGTEDKKVHRSTMYSIFIFAFRLPHLFEFPR